MLRFLADPGKTDLFFTDAGILQVENLNIELAPELKELIGPPKRTGGLPIPIAYGARRVPTNLL